MNSTNIPVGDVAVELLDRDDAIVRMMGAGKIWEPETRKVWQRLVIPGAVVLDVGAYTGIYAIASALMGARVIALEPHPTNYRRLRANAALNSVKIDMLENAAGDRMGKMPLMLTKPLECISDTGTLADIGNEITMVHCIPIDAMRFDSPLALIKIDVEGYEATVLNGAMQIISAHKPALVIETLTQAATNTVDCMMIAMGYDCDAVLDTRNRLYRRLRSSRMGI